MMSAADAQEAKLVSAVSLNRSVSWFSNPSAWAFYALLLVGARWAVYVFLAHVLDPAAQWTVTHVLHGLVRVGSVPVCGALPRQAPHRAARFVWLPSETRRRWHRPRPTGAQVSFLGLHFKTDSPDWNDQGA